MPPLECWRGVRPKKGGELASARKGCDLPNRRDDGGRDHRANARYRHQPASLLVGLDRLDELVVNRRDRLIQRVDLSRQRRERNANVLGNHDLTVFVRAVGQHPLQPIGVLGALGRHHPDLAQMPAQRIEQRRALTDKLLANPMAHRRLVVDRTQSDEPLTGTHRRLADRRCVGRIRLVAPYVRLHMRRRDQFTS